MHLAFTFAAIATGIAVVASALRGKRYFHGDESVIEELAEGAAESAGIFGLDETAGLPGITGAPAPSSNGNGVGAASAASGSESSAQNG
ncbi:MAG: hypothetical protein ACRDPY_49610, partial [Streptosporangiaceae bacterium]